MKKLKERFGKIPQSVFKKMKSIDRQPIAKYNNIMRSIERDYIAIEDLKDDIKELESKIDKNSNRCEKIYNQNKHLEEEYSMNMNVSTNIKKLKDGSEAIYWMINLKYKGYNKPIYLGSDKKVREIVSKVIESKRRLSKDRLKSEIWDMCFEKLYIMVMTKENLYNEKIKFEDLI